MPKAEVYDPLATGSAWHRNRAKLVIYTLLGLFALYYILPLGVVILNSLRDLPDISRNGLIGFPRSFSLGNWSRAWSKVCVGGTCEGIQPFFFNSVSMVLPATIISTAIGAINGYVLSKWRFTGSGILFAIITLGVFMPGQMVLLPWARVLGWLGLTNTTTGLVLIHCVQGLSFTTLFCRNYYVNIPDDLIKAARIDGAGFWRIFRKIVLPLSPSILIVTIIWQFTNIWNEFLFAVIFSSGTHQPITAALIALSAGGTSVHEYNVESAAVL
ncbi:MAG: carbohydrate ABC transporter permease, partial [Verrucomicrobia bacterium]|nr:carbohydrate ABC transporter permease [Verrucomicrobiota bacterium]